MILDGRSGIIVEDGGGRFWVTGVAWYAFILNPDSDEIAVLPRVVCREYAQWI
jgi:hypothetical protein